MLYFVIDAFVDKNFKGNPAGVCILEEKLDDEILQNIAFENNLAETAFVLKNGGYYDLRWFTPLVEVDLCGHATLAAAFAINNYVEKSKKIEFHTKSGILYVERNNDIYMLNFPTRKPEPIERTIEMQRAVGAKVLEAYSSRDLMLVLEDEKTVRELKPNMDLICSLENIFGVIVTAKGDDSDFVSRFFCPKAGISEDYVTGSSHTTLIPYWADILKKDKMIATQLSKRGGKLFCEYHGDRVKIGGKAKIFLKGEIIL